jgi:hypothetical protein
MTDDLKPTHIAYAKNYLTKNLFEWLEIGWGRWDPKTGEFHHMLNRGILGASMKYARYVPIGKGPPPVEPEKPVQPTAAQTGDEEEI